ncbi:MAG: hypothetical protein HONBIEJF_00939 [Fimbriimonadaceae bacterium]|nr:hypothetical protein [Fimbriimonadaceae bacterium]
MKRNVAYFLLLFVSVAVVTLARVSPQDAVALAYVRLQSSTPGTQQTGHLNVSGAIIGGEHVGNGAGLTGVNANLLDGLDSTSFLQSVPLPLVLTGNAAPALLQVTNTHSSAPAISAKGALYGMLADGLIGIRSQSDVVGGSGIQGLATASTGLGVGGYFVANSSNGTAVHGSVIAGTGTGLAGDFYVDGENQKAIFARNGTTSGSAVAIHGRSSAFSGIGVFGEVNSTASGTSSGGYFSSRSTNGRGVYGAALAATGAATGGRFESMSSTGIGVYGETLATTGVNYGGYFEGASNMSRAAVGWATATTGTTYGMLGQADSTNGRGVAGFATASTGIAYGGRFESDSTSGRGIYALATSTTGTNYGVRGATNSGSGYGIFADGDLGASGSKSFRIDHPLDPENRYLLHYASESPYPQNFYSGNVVTDSRGYAWVELPSYFSSINANFKYQLTVLDDSDSTDFVMAKVSKEIRGNRFQVRTSAPNTKVSWRIEADRSDLYMRRKKPAAEVEKLGEERGRYQQPELYGQPGSSSLDHSGSDGSMGAASSKAGSPRH